MSQQSPQVGLPGCFWICAGVVCVAGGVLTAAKLKVSPIAGALAGAAALAALFAAYVAVLWVLGWLRVIK